uniref:Hydroxysteroid 17-beta dehydrogenase 4 n=1 Tax=Ditylenchus dipsaci TaxID=166011 RepID=A0A915DSW3_9BILA
MDAEAAKKFGPRSSTFKYTTRDAILYALGIGATTSRDLHFLYENHENFQVFPTFVVASGLLASSFGDWPGITYNFAKILHGEQYIELFDSLPNEAAELRNETRILDVLDKSSGAVIISEVTTYDNKSGKKLAVQEFALFQVGSGNFGGHKNSQFERKAPSVPARPADKIAEECVALDQATLYRLGGGDLNPLHIDPEFAKMAGFSKPILHGLCSLGIAAKQILREYGDNDAANFQAIKVRFSAPVYPGQTLVTEMWKEGKRIHFQTKVKETCKVVISNGFVDLHVDKPSSSDSTKTVESKSRVKSSVIFETIKNELPNNRELISKLNAIVLYDITKDSKHAAYYTLDFKNGKGAVYEGEPKNSEKPSTTVTVDDDDFVKLASGKLDGIKSIELTAFMSGKLKVKGNLMLLQKLQSILAKARPTSKL